MLKAYTHPSLERDSIFNNNNTFQSYCNQLEKAKSNNICNNNTIMMDKSHSFFITRHRPNSEPIYRCWHSKGTALGQVYNSNINIKQTFTIKTTENDYRRD